jgi:hypothetical protein
MIRVLFIMTFGVSLRVPKQKAEYLCPRCAPGRIGSLDNNVRPGSRNPPIHPGLRSGKYIPAVSHSAVIVPLG